MCSIANMWFPMLRHTNVTTFSRSPLAINTFFTISFANSRLEANIHKLKPISVRHSGTQVNQISAYPNSENVPTNQRQIKKPTSAAMKYYLEKKRQHDAFIAKERSEFELGKKHLANMMGMSYEAMTQEDVDKAIEYLFPSGLYHPDARPKMKPPEEVG